MGRRSAAEERKILAIAYGDLGSHCEKYGELPGRNGGRGSDQRRIHGREGGILKEAYGSDVESRAVGSGLGG